MYYRSIEQYQHLTSQPANHSGGHLLTISVLMAVLINVYFGMSSATEHLNPVTATQVEMKIQMASLGFRN